MRHILAIDPGNVQSGYVLVEHDGDESRRVLEVGKIDNTDVFRVLRTSISPNGVDVAIEMIAGLGMPVGQEVFDTCFWIGRFWEVATLASGVRNLKKIFRRDNQLKRPTSRIAAPEPLV